jgi:hypothetical protein
VGKRIGRAGERRLDLDPGADLRRVDVEQHQLVEVAVERVGGGVDLARERAVDEAFLLE